MSLPVREMKTNILSAVAILTTVILTPSFSIARTPLTDSLDVRISNTQEWESSVFVSPLNPNIILVANNGIEAWISEDGGSTWQNDFPYISGGYDPSVAICANSSLGEDGRFFVKYLTSGTGEKPQIVRYKDGPDR